VRREAVVTRDDRLRWDDGQLWGLAVQVLDGKDACCDDLTTSSAGDLRPAELSLSDVVASGRAACCWLDVIVHLRSVIRRHGSDAGVSTDRDSSH
jgi:hypothetical protein